MDLCAEVETSRIASGDMGPGENDLVYEFASLNFLSEPMPLAFHTIKNLASTFNTQRNSNFSKKSKSSIIIFNGFQIKCSTYHLDKTKTLNNISTSTNNLHKKFVITVNSR